LRSLRNPGVSEFGLYTYYYEIHQKLFCFRIKNNMLLKKVLKSMFLKRIMFYFDWKLCTKIFLKMILIIYKVCTKVDLKKKSKNPNPPWFARMHDKKNVFYFSIFIIRLYLS